MIMQAEPMGTLNLDTTAAKCLGLDNLDEEQLKVISAMQLSKPVCPSEAACVCLGIDMVRRSDAVTFIDTAPMDLRRISLFHFNATSVPPVDTYCARPPELEQLKLKEYFENYLVLKPDKPHPANHTYLATDILGNKVCSFLLLSLHPIISLNLCPTSPM